MVSPGAFRGRGAKLERLRRGRGGNILFLFKMPDAAVSRMGLQSLSGWTIPPAVELEARLCHIQSVMSHHVTAPGSTHDRIQKQISSCDPSYRHSGVMITTQEAMGKGSVFLVCACSRVLGDTG